MDGGSDVDFREIYQFALDATKNCGQMILKAFNENKTVSMKSNPQDLVTLTDQAVEKHLILALSHKYPSHKFCGEESFDANSRFDLGDEPTWMIDPIDGTMNFVHMFPYCCISVAFLFQKEPVIGIVYNPMNNELFSAMSNYGAFLNGFPIQVTECKALPDALVQTEMSRRSDLEPENSNKIFRSMKRLQERCHGLRNLGSAALDLCYVARGAVDCYYENGIHCWDMAAGVCIAKEAGAHVMDMSGGKFDLMSRRVLCAATPSLANEIQPLLEYVEYPKD